MSRPLVRAQQIVESRLRGLGQKINDVLAFRDQRLRFDKRAMRSGPTTWVLRNHAEDEAALNMPLGYVAELGAARNDDSILYFGYNEEWQPARGRDQIEFVASNLRFVISGVEEMPDLRFRLEWAGAKTEGGAVGYPGVGAAHPHWQFDVDDGWVDTRIAHGDEPIVINLEPPPERIDLGDMDGGGEGEALALPPRRVSATLAGFHHLHLPARTMWHELMCDMPGIATPHQHTPACEDEIDRWVISALRYIKSEFEAYL